MDTQNEHKPNYRTLDDTRLTADEMDEQRKENIAYEYLCHLEEAKIWIQACINEELPPTTELEEGLRNGVILAKLGHFFSAATVPVKKIYDRDQARYLSRGLHFRHTDNINHWLRAMNEIGLPTIFYPETTDIYDRKNMPRAVYCVHALSLFLFKLGLAPQIQDLYGKIEFTEEEISFMRSELDKYGIQMPAFSKIGGILANEMTVDDAALHAAIIAINEAVDQGEAANTMTKLENPSAMLVNLDTENTGEYQDTLSTAKMVKAENTRNKSINPDILEKDVYDELLTQAEIQGNVNKVNSSQALRQLDAVLLGGDSAALLAALQHPALGLKNVQPDNIDFYASNLRQCKHSKSEADDAELSKDEIQACVDTSNLEANFEYQKNQTVTNVNAAVQSGDVDLLMKSLANPLAKLTPVEVTAGHLYLEEMISMRNDKGEDLDYDEIEAGLKVLEAVTAINKAIDQGHSQNTMVTLNLPNACLGELDEVNEDKYQASLATQKSNKADLPNSLLSHSEILACIASVHDQVQEEHDRIMAITAINEAVDKGQEEETLEALQMPTAKLCNVEPAEALLYQILLARAKDQKADASNGETAVLWLEEVQAGIDKANANCQEGLRLSAGVKEVNSALQEEGEDGNAALLAALTSPTINVHSVTGECIEAYREALQTAVADTSQQGETGSGWTMNRVKDGTKFFYNVNNGEHAWTRTEGLQKDYSLLTRDDVQQTVSHVTAAHDRNVLFKSNEGLITKIQACYRGYNARKAYKERVNFMKTQLPAILKIQALWRGLTQKRKYQDRVNYLKDNADTVILLQSYYRMWKARSKYQDRLKYFKDSENAIIKLQAFFRSNLAQQDYKALMSDENPSLAVVRKFVHLLDASDNDYAEELELQKLREQVVAEIRSNQQLESDLDQMDIKIGLLIKNRITLQDVVTHNKKLTKQVDDQSKRGLKALSKEHHVRLEAYQHLFYLLQTCPSYLAKLIFEMPQSRTTKFMEAVIYSLFNYGSNQREEYLLTKLFQTALEEEINSKVVKMTDIVTGNPLVVKMIVGFNRNQRGQNALKEMLNPLIMSVIEDRNLRINTNPVEVYKAWVNQTESSTGKTSGLPYDVSSEQALAHEEVKVQIEETIQRLQKVTDRFLNTILSSLDSIPYGMRYMAKVMKECLVKKFPDAQEKDILKIVGNLLYYRYINSAIVAPDAFDIVNIGAEKALSNDQRRNLGSIAKILQFAASNKGFGGESSYLASMNDYIRNAHEKFKKYCLAACDVDEPEVKFNVDQYSDVTMISKPVIYISVGEIVDTHQLLLQHQDVIAAEASDPLHELLEDLGEAPTIDELLGTELTGDEATNEALRSEMAKTEISLTLSSKLELQADDSSADLKSLMIRTKRMIVDVIACQSGDNLVVILDLPSNQAHEEMHQAMVKKRDLMDKKMAQKQTEGGKKLVRHASILGDTRLPIEVMKQKIKSNLQTLEQGGVVSRHNKYQDLLNSIVQDIRNQRRYRNNRKQELMRLRTTIKSLSEKRTFYESQIDYYNQYVKTCLDSLQQKSKKNRKSGLFGRKDGQKTMGSVVYTAAKLQEKGVVLEIENLPQNQFKNVVFEIKPTESAGVFDVDAKFMGVAMDKVELVFQELLQLQYEGVAVMKMFNRAKINVNLLIFLLNRKFYGKQLVK